jgi:hypothetical protein
MNLNKQNSIKNEKAWVNLPDNSLLPTYFRRKDLIELSKVNKNYRHQLRTQVFSSVVMPTVKKLTKNYNHKNSGKSMSNFILDMLSIDLAGKLNLVNKLIIRTTISDATISYFSVLFPKLKHITILSYTAFGYTNFIKSFSESKYLESILIECKNVNYTRLDYQTNYDFFHRLKSIRLKIPFSLNPNSPTDVIDSSFNNLKHLTFVNNRMLIKLSEGLPSLKSAEFLKGCDFEKEKFSLFIRNNPQLKILSVSALLLDEEAVKSIMALNKLDRLIITDNLWDLDDKLNTISENHSIKHFTYTGIYYNDKFLKILNLCKNVKVFELLPPGIQFFLFALNGIPEIETLLIPHSYNLNDLIWIVSGIKKFKQIKLRNGPIFNEVCKKYVTILAYGWVKKYNYSLDTNEFTLIKK